MHAHSHALQNTWPSSLVLAGGWVCRLLARWAGLGWAGVEFWGSPSTVEDEGQNTRLGGVQNHRESQSWMTVGLCFLSPFCQAWGEGG